MSKLNKIYNQLGLLNNETENNQFQNLTKVPKRDNKTNTPHTSGYIRNYDQQADLLFLPNDSGFRYLLVVTDIATYHMDAEQLKDKEAKNVRENM